MANQVELIFQIIQLWHMLDIFKFIVPLLNLFQVILDWLVHLWWFLPHSLDDKCLNLSKFDLKLENLDAIKKAIVLVVSAYFWVEISFGVQILKYVLHCFCVTVKTNFLVGLFVLV